MASNGERRMLFDIQGKRKQVVRVVYAILALLMGASLFLVVGPVSIGELIGSSNSGSASQVFDDQAERIEARLARNPEDAAMLLALTRARINAGNAQLEPVSETETPTVSPEALEDFEAASAAWSLYLKEAGDEPSPAGAQLVAGTFFRLAESASLGLPETERNIAMATKAQRIAAEQQPSPGSLSNLAIYQYFNGEFAAGDKTTKRVAAESPSKAEAKNVERQLKQFRGRAKQYEKQKKELREFERKVGRQSLQNPFSSGLGGVPPATGE